MARVRLPSHVYRVTNRVGKVYTYYQPGRSSRDPGKRIRLPDPDENYDSFLHAYAVARGLRVEKPTNDVLALVEAWQASPEWSALSPKTRAEWARYVGRIVQEWGRLQVAGIEPRHVLWLRDKYASTPASANNLLRCLSSMLAWSVPRGWRRDNPCREVKPLKGSMPYEPWPLSMIEEARRELRDDQWHAVALALYTGQRLGDVLAMRWDAIRDGRITVRQAKTGKVLAIRPHRDLQSILDAIPRRAVTILTTIRGTPWTVDGFKASWNKRKACKGVVFHGLRKSAVVTLLECGCTTAEVQAITGQSIEMVEHYARGRDQARLADAAVLKWERQK